MENIMANQEGERNALFDRVLDSAVTLANANGDDVLRHAAVKLRHQNGELTQREHRCWVNYLSALLVDNASTGIIYGYLMMQEVD
jgi:hypothetical protein